MFLHNTSAHADKFPFLSSRIGIEVGILPKFATPASLCATRQNPQASEGSEGEQTQTEPVCPLKKRKKKKTKKKKRQ